VKTSNRTLVLCTLLSSVITFMFIACGGGKMTGGLPIPIPGITTKHVTIANTAHGGTHTSVKSNKKLATLALAFFQTSTPTEFAESYEGFCAQTPPSDNKFVLNNAGVYSGDDCFKQWFGEGNTGENPKSVVQAPCNI
jgi:hypothetical protein